MKPNFKEMTLDELTVYVKEHREDMEAWNIFADQMSADATIYPAPLDQAGIETMEKVLREKLNK